MFFDKGIYINITMISITSSPLQQRNVLKTLRMHIALLQKNNSRYDDQKLAATTHITTKIAPGVRAHKTIPLTRSLPGTIS
jgi:hypothetical protein